jgi:hypothetical protein
MGKRKVEGCYCWTCKNTKTLDRINGKCSPAERKVFNDLFVAFESEELDREVSEMKLSAIGYILTGGLTLAGEVLDIVRKRQGRSNG